MLKKILLTMLVFCLTCMPVVAAKTIQVEFTYSQDAEAFHLYMNEERVCTDTTLGTMVCDAIEIPYGTYIFTLTAVTDGVESSPSPGYMWTHVPQKGAQPVVLKFLILAEDGSTTEVGRVNVD